MLEELDNDQFIVPMLLGGRWHHLRNNAKATKTRPPARPLYELPEFKKRYGYGPIGPAPKPNKFKLALAGTTTSAPESALLAIDRAADEAERVATKLRKQQSALAPWHKFLQDRQWYFNSADFFGQSPAVERRLDGSLNLHLL